MPLIPLGELAAALHRTGPQPQILIHCKTGVRSLKAVKFLQEQGFKYVKSVKGGINAWSDEIDHTVAKY